MRNGIKSKVNQHGEFISIEQNSFSEAISTNLAFTEHCGMLIERSAAAASPGIPSHVSIGLNNFDITTNNYYTAIAVEGANTAGDELRVSRNYPISLNNLPPFGFGKGVYIRTMNAENTNVGGNEVNIDGFVYVAG